MRSGDGGDRILRNELTAESSTKPTKENETTAKSETVSGVKTSSDRSVDAAVADTKSDQKQMKRNLLCLSDSESIFFQLRAFQKEKMNSE